MIDLRSVLLCVRVYLNSARVKFVTAMVIWLLVMMTGRFRFMWRSILF